MATNKGTAFILNNELIKKSLDQYVDEKEKNEGKSLRASIGAMLIEKIQKELEGKKNNGKL